MKKPSLATLTILVLAAVFVGLILAGLVMAQENQPWFPGPEPESISLNLGTVTIANGYYHVPLTVTDTTSTKIDKLEISPADNGTLAADKAGITATVNGTATSIGNPLNYKLNSGDKLQINFALPTSEYTSNTTISATVYSPQAMYYEEARLP